MKKVFLILIAVIGFGTITNAQDVITLKNGEEIQALVQEIGEFHIKYKNFHNLDGPDYILNKSEILIIHYANGTKDIFLKETKPAVQENLYNPLSRDLQDEFDKIGKGDKKMLAFFKENNFTRYHNDFKSACTMGNIGANLIAIGSIPTLIGTVYMVLNDSREYWIGATVCIVVGGSLMITGIPLSASASARKRSIKNNFGEKFGIRGYTYQPTLNFGCTGNGLGVTLNF